MFGDALVAVDEFCGGEVLADEMADKDIVGAAKNDAIERCWLGEDGEQLIKDDADIDDIGYFDLGKFVTGSEVEFVGKIE